MWLEIQNECNKSVSTVLEISRFYTDFAARNVAIKLFPGSKISLLFCTDLLIFLILISNHTICNF